MNSEDQYPKDNPPIVGPDSSDNKQLLQFLKYYCDLDGDPYYAIMVKGAWGSGKTYIVDKFIKAWATVDKPYVYVSLYGISDTRQIDDALFSALHPVLGSKALKIGGRIFKGTLKAALKIDIDGDGHDDGTINIQLPDVSLVETLSADGHVVIFDDLERCSASIVDIMGYINRFVEHGGQKVIVIANEEEFSSEDLGKESRYRKIKEKLIGKTFEVRPQVEEALQSFVGEIHKGESKEFLKKESGFISDIYRQSKTQNLRILRHAIGDYARLYDTIGENYKKKEDAIKHLLGVMLCLCFEIRSGRIEISEIDGLIANYSFFTRKDETEKQIRLRETSERYPLVNLGVVILSNKSWAEIVDQSYLDKLRIESELDQSGYYKTDKFEEWRNLWYITNINQEEFDVALSIVLNKIDKRYYTDRGVIMHVAGVLLELAVNSLCDIPQDKIEVMMKTYIDDILGTDRLEGSQINTSLRTDMGYEGLGFQSTDNVHFQNILKHFREKLKANYEAKFPQMALSLLEIMRSDPEEYLIKTCHTNSRDNIYAEVPLFSSIDPFEYVAKVRAAPIEYQSKIFMAFHMRYDHQALYRNLSAELPWVQQVQEIWNSLRNLTALESNRLRIYRKNYIDTIDTKREDGRSE